MIRRGIATVLFVASLTTIGCSGAGLAGNDEVTTRMNARDEKALQDAGPGPDATATKASKTEP